MTGLTMRGRHRTVNGIRLHYLEQGAGGPPLVVLPGITSPAATWAFIAERLAEFSHVYTLDHRGRGLSAAGAALGYRLGDYATDTIALIEALGLVRPVLLGHSMGARIAVAAAAARADIAAGLILVDPPVSGPGRRPYPLPLQWYLDSIAATARGAPLVVTGTPMANWDAQAIALREQWLPTCDPAAIAESHRSFQEEDIHALLPAIRCRTLLLCAERGGTITAEEETEIVTAIRECRSLRMPGVGHMIPWDDLEGFLAAVRAFLASD